MVVQLPVYTMNQKLHSDSNQNDIVNINVNTYNNYIFLTKSNPLWLKSTWVCPECERLNVNKVRTSLNTVVTKCKQ